MTEFISSPNFIMAAPWLILAMCHVIWSIQDNEPIFGGFVLIIIIAGIASLLGDLFTGQSLVPLLLFSIAINGFIMTIFYWMGDDDES